MITTTILFLRSRRGYYVRLRGPALDTKIKVPDERFTAEGVDPLQPPRNRRGTQEWDVNDPHLQIAQRFADEERNRRSSTFTTRHAEMSLEEIWQQYTRTNPEQVKAETLKVYGKWTRALLRCRCAKHGDRRCVAHRPPSTTTLTIAEELRNARLMECRSCGIIAADHPKPSTWKDRKTPTHGFMAVSPRTVANELGWLMHLIDYALERPTETGVKSKSLTRVPTIVGKRGIHAKPKYTPAEFLRIFEAAGQVDERYQALCALDIATGLREHPLTYFDRRWYDRAARMIHIPAEHMKGRGDSYRPLDVPVSEWAAAIIEQWISDDRLLLFPNPKTGQVQQNFSVVEARVTELAGLSRKVTFHAFRGSFNSWLTNHRCEKHTAEVPFFVREKLLGHALPAQVEAYTRFSDDTLREAVGVIDCIAASLFGEQRRTARRGAHLQLVQR